MKSQVFALLLLLVGATAAQAGNFKLDGCLGCDGESYDSVVGVNFSFDDGSTGTGSISYGSDAAYDYIYIRLAEEYINNVYAAGYDERRAPVEGYRSRAFKKLEKSDALGGDGPLIISHANGIDSISLVVDLISRCRDDASCNNGSGWDSAGVDENFSGGDGEIKYDTSDNNELSNAIQGIESSMSYNIAQIGASFDEYEASATYENNGSWLNYVGYEFKFTKDLVGAVQEIGAHASPALRKLDGTCIAGDPGCGPCVPGTPGCGTTEINEPGTLALFASLLLLTRLRREDRHSRAV